MIFTESVRSATHLANQGNFQSAIELLGDRWQGVGVEPVRNGDGDLDYAHLLLVCGILTVKMGHFGNGLQADAKDLLSKAVRLFGDGDGRYEALLWLATAYVFCGEYKESLAVVDSILAEQRANVDVEFSAAVLKGYVHMGLGDSTSAEKSFSSVTVLLAAVSPVSAGKFYLTRGMFFRQAGRFDEALADYDLAFISFSRADSPRYQAAVKNNQARVFIEQGKLSDARDAAEVALQVFIDLQDTAHEAKVWDEMARIYEREENYREMVRCADRAVGLLAAGDHEGWLAEALITQGIARARLGMAEAREILDRALEICERQGDPKQADAATKAMWDIVQRGKETRQAVREGFSDLERTVFERVLEKHNGKISPAARELGLHHNRFQWLLTNCYPELLRKRSRRIRRHRSIMRPA